MDPAGEPVIRKFLIQTIDRFGTLIRQERGYLGTRTFTRRVLN